MILYIWDPLKKNYYNLRNNKYFLLLFTSVLFVFLYNTYNVNSINYKRNIHKENLKNSPFKKSYNLTKTERKKNELPPNKYSEKMWELSMNPIDGKPNPEKLFPKSCTDVVLSTVPSVIVVTTVPSVLLIVYAIYGIYYVLTPY